MTQPVVPPQPMSPTSVGLKKTFSQAAPPATAPTLPGTSTPHSAKPAASPHRPWYYAGGMQVNMAGIGVNIVVPLLVLTSTLSSTELYAFLALLVVSFLAAAASGSRTIYCIAVVPTFFVSLILSFRLGVPGLLFPLSTIVLSVAVAITKVNICMSVCLHRYAAHVAFRCGPVTKAAIAVLGCLANQGGPIWWASQHRCHHKHCEQPRDPHSATVDGTELAFAFFEKHQDVEEDFAPPHMESLPMRVLDTWAWVCVFAEMAAAYHLLDAPGLFVSYTSAWICQSITLWFNIANHPPQVEEKCKASNESEGRFELNSNFLPFHVLHALFPLFGFFVAEGEHKHHHNNAALAQREQGDTAYWMFIAPLEALGLVWNVNRCA